MKVLDQDTLNNIVNSNISPQQFICASLLGMIAEFITEPQEIIDVVAKVIGPNLYEILKSGEHIKDNYSNFKDFVMDINRALDICDRLDVISNGDVLEIQIHQKANGCRYCPKNIGGAELDGDGCPLPMLFEVMGKKAGFNYVAIRGENGYLTKENRTCKIRYHIPNQSEYEEVLKKIRAYR
ncbi:hypothetical protein [Methanothermococcus sp.]|uniref:hypothetical protein n=1 Tax=Methanothermococcus sp. TaxID=2614238 RepID=UPI0025F7C1B6|nr:hypothetical protein [Methanothermococcus sp.]